MKSIFSFILVFITYQYISAQTPFTQNGKSGLKNNSGKIILPAEYKLIKHFHYGLAIISKDLKTFGLANKSGKIIVPLNKYNYVEALSEQFIKFQGKSIYYGVMDTTGRIILYETDEFSVINKFSNRYFSVGKYGKTGLIDTSGNEIIPAYCDRIYELGRHLLILQQNNKYGIAKTTGEKITAIDFDEIDEHLSSEPEARAKVKRNGKYGFISEKGKLVIPCVYSEATTFAPQKFIQENEKLKPSAIVQTDLALVKQNNRRFYIDVFGKEVKNQ